VTLAYPGADDDGDLAAFADAMMQSRWLTEVGADYGVGTGTHTRVLLPALDDAGRAAPIGIDSVGHLVAALLDDGGLPTWPDGGVEGFIYLALPPDGVWSNDVGPGGGQHGVYDAGRPLVVGYVTRYDANPSQAESHREILAHEMIEAATDPYITVDPAYLVQSGPLQVYGNIDSENADLCAGSGTAAVDGVVYPRIWSNSASLAQQDPCLPHTQAPWMTVLGPGATVRAAPGNDVFIPVTGVTSDPTLVDWPIHVTSNGPGRVYVDNDRIEAGQTIYLRVHLPDPIYELTTIFVSSGDQAPLSMTLPLLVGTCRD
jgi:hypothetical protein